MSRYGVAIERAAGQLDEAGLHDAAREARASHSAEGGAAILHMPTLLAAMEQAIRWLEETHAQPEVGDEGAQEVLRNLRAARSQVADSAAFVELQKAEASRLLHSSRVALDRMAIRTKVDMIGDERQVCGFEGCKLPKGHMTVLDGPAE